MNYSLTNDDIMNYQNKIAAENEEANRDKENNRKLATDIQNTVLNALSLPTNNPGQPIQQQPVNQGGAWNNGK